jgi:hypothetical protein
MIDGGAEKAVKPPFMCDLGRPTDRGDDEGVNRQGEDNTLNAAGRIARPATAPVPAGLDGEHQRHAAERESSKPGTVEERAAKTAIATLPMATSTEIWTSHSRRAMFL